MVTSAFNSSTLETEAGRTYPGLLGLHILVSWGYMETLCQKTPQNNKKAAVRE